MELLRRHAYARAGLMGNPSDGYFGKTLSIIVRNFRAEVVLYEWEDMEIVLTQEDRSRFRSVKELVRDVKLHGYYGGIRLIKATIKRFVEYCRGRHTLHDRNFAIRYATNIPRQVGLAGSSAIIVATMRALLEFYQIAMPLDVQPSFVLSVEKEELGIAAGLQDRVVQVYGGLVFMDFSRGAWWKRTASSAASMNRSTRDYCHPCISPTAKMRGNLPKCCTTICGPALTPGRWLW